MPLLAGARSRSSSSLVGSVGSGATTSCGEAIVRRFGVGDQCDIKVMVLWEKFELRPSAR